MSLHERAVWEGFSLGGFLTFLVSLIGGGEFGPGRNEEPSKTRLFDVTGSCFSFSPGCPCVWIGEKNVATMYKLRTL